jgi:hypothetical protein
MYDLTDLFVQILLEYNPVSSEIRTCLSSRYSVGTTEDLMKISWRGREDQLEFKTCYEGRGKEKSDLPASAISQMTRYYVLEIVFSEIPSVFRQTSGYSIF